MDNPELAAIVDVVAYPKDPTYHYTIDLLDLWVSAVREILSTEVVVPEETTDRVVSLLVTRIQAGQEDRAKRQASMDGLETSIFLT